MTLQSGIACVQVWSYRTPDSDFLFSSGDSIPLSKFIYILACNTREAMIYLVPSEDLPFTSGFASASWSAD